MKRRHLLWVGGWAIATAFAVLAFRQVQWGEVLRSLTTIEPGWIVVAVAANLLILVFWSMQWRLFAPRDASISGREMFRITALTSTTANGGPLLAAQAVAVHLLGRRDDMEYAGAVSVVALDQLAEGLAKLALLGVVASLTPLPPVLRAGVGFVTAFVAGLVVVLGIGAWRGSSGTEPPAPPKAREGLLGRLYQRARSFGLRAGHHLHTLRTPSTAAGGMALALCMKAAELGGIMAVQRALGVHLGVGPSLVVLASVVLATMVPLAPANLGVYEAAAFAAYRLADVDVAMATTLALVQHATFLLVAAGTGWVLLTARGTRTAWQAARREATRTPEAPS